MPLNLIPRNAAPAPRDICIVPALSAVAFIKGAFSPVRGLPIDRFTISGFISSSSGILTIGSLFNPYFFTRLVMSIKTSNIVKPIFVDTSVVNKIIVITRFTNM